jgi:hypothetical protein
VNLITQYPGARDKISRGLGRRILTFHVAMEVVCNRSRFCLVVRHQRVSIITNSPVICLCLGVFTRGFPRRCTVSEPLVKPTFHWSQGLFDLDSPKDSCAQEYIKSYMDVSIHFIS